MIRSLRLALAVLVLSASTAFAAPPPPPTLIGAVDPVYGETYDAISSGFDRELVIDNMLMTMVEQLKTDPGIAGLAKKDDQLLPDFIEAIRPAIRSYAEESNNLMRAAIAPKLAETMSVQEAEAVIAFFQSELGQRMIQATARNYKGTATLANVVDQPDAPITRAQIQSDAKSATAGAIAELSASDLKAIDAFGRSPAGTAFHRAQPKILAARLEIENRPIPQPMMDEMIAAVQAVMAQHFPSP